MMMAITIDHIIITIAILTIEIITITIQTIETAIEAILKITKTGVIWVKTTQTHLTTITKTIILEIDRMRMEQTMTTETLETTERIRLAEILIIT